MNSVANKSSKSLIKKAVSRKIKPSINKIAKIIEKIVARASFGL